MDIKSDKIDHNMIRNHTSSWQSNIYWPKKLTMTGFEHYRILKFKRGTCKDPVINRLHFLDFDRHCVFSFILRSTAETEARVPSTEDKGMVLNMTRVYGNCTQYRQKVLGLKLQLSFHISRWPVFSQQDPKNSVIS